MIRHGAPDVADVTIRRLSNDDLEGALALSTTAGWNQRADDWRMLTGLAPAGSFAAVAGSRIVGTAIGIDYGAFSWVAMMLVDPAYRGRGLGRRLLAAALGALPAGTPVRLDATPMGRPLYRSYGFEDEAAITRCVREALVPDGQSRARGRGSAEAGAGALVIRQMTAGDLSRIALHDRDVFGADRAAVLAWAFEGAPGYARVVDSDSAAPVQYCLGRQGRLFDQVGPVVAAGDAAARALVREALAVAPAAAVIDVFDERRGFAEWLRDLGFRAQRPLFRMCLPARGGVRDGPVAEPLPPRMSKTDRGGEEGVVEFAILGPDVG